MVGQVGNRSMAKLHLILLDGLMVSLALRTRKGLSQVEPLATNAWMCEGLCMGMLVQTIKSWPKVCPTETSGYIHRGLVSAKARYYPPRAIRKWRYLL